MTYESSKDNTVLVGYEEIAQAWGVTSRTVRKWELDPAEIRGKAHFFKLEDVVANRAQAPGDWKAERTRKEKELADKYEISNQISRGELVKSHDVADRWVKYIETCKHKLLGIKSRVNRILAMNCSAQIPLEEIKRVENAIDGEIKTALSELARGNRTG